MSQKNYSQNDGFRPGSSQDHSALVAKTILAVSKTGLACVWRNETGVALRIHDQRHFAYGLKGSPDIIGILKNGKFVGLECKTGRAVATKEQLNFQKMCANFNAHCAIIRSEIEAVELIKVWTLGG